MFFSRDEALIHRHRFMADFEAWRAFDWEGRRTQLLEDYAGYFSHAAADQLCGEGSTSYLPSPSAALRIRELNPEAKIIVVLRNPVDRAYSAYWHYLATGESCHDFEGHLRYESGMTLAMGHYQEHLGHWFQHFPAEQIQVVILERLKNDTAGEYRRVLRFLGIEPRTPPPANANPARVPRWPRLQAFSNYLMQRWPAPGGLHWAGARLSAWNLSVCRYPPMNKRTRAHLTDYYRRKNAGLAQRLDLDLEAIWYGDSSQAD